MGSSNDILLWSACVSWKRVTPNVNRIDMRMALMELRMLVAALVMKYTWSGIPDKSGKWDEEMWPFDTTVIHPCNGKCVLKIEPRSDLNE